MKSIQMVDLASQYARLKPEIDASIQQVLDKSAYINGPDVKAFANDLSQWNRCIANCINGFGFAHR
jgi:dTDP-4-amino-4,6-dideoxygalactose transaminase